MQLDKDRQRGQSNNSSNSKLLEILGGLKPENDKPLVRRRERLSTIQSDQNYMWLKNMREGSVKSDSRDPSDDSRKDALTKKSKDIAE